jgi:hypothetical protein
MTGYATIRQSWTIAFGAQPRSRGALSAPLLPPEGLIRRAAMRIAFGRRMYPSHVTQSSSGYSV